VHWTNVDFGAADTVEIASLDAPNVAGHAMKGFCAAFNHGDLMSMTGGATTLEGDGGGAFSELSAGGTCTRSRHRSISRARGPAC
jgi:hypothetical protein